jgi:hypothetical protein
MSDRDQEIKDYHLKKLAKVHAEIDRKYKLKIRRLYIIAAFAVGLLYLIFFT